MLNSSLTILNTLRPVNIEEENSIPCRCANRLTQLGRPGLWGYVIYSTCLAHTHEYQLVSINSCLLFRGLFANLIYSKMKVIHTS